MDKSKKYIKMCQEATELNEIKWDYGFAPGDWIYLGDEGVKVIGTDIFEVAQTVGIDKNDDKFAVLELAKTNGDVVFEVDGTDIDILVSKFPVDSYVSAIWLPRQDQLESFYYQAILYNVNVINWIDVISEFRNTRIVDQYKTMEQMSLAIIMNIKYNKEWDVEVEDWTKIS